MYLTHYGLHLLKLGIKVVENRFAEKQNKITFLMSEQALELGPDQCRGDG
jgi:hypothetical protein